MGTSSGAPSPHTAASPFTSTSPQFPQLEAKWTKPIPALCTFVEGLVGNAILSDELFQTILLFICLCFGQDESEYVFDTIWAALYDVLNLMLGPKGGRKGEQILHGILDGKVKMPAKTGKWELPEADRKIARGGVM